MSDEVLYRCVDCKRNVWQQSEYVFVDINGRKWCAPGFFHVPAPIK